MTRLTLQFHADRIELLTMARAWARELRLFTVWERFAPTYSAAFINDEAALIRKDALRPEIDRVSFSLHPVDIDAASSLEYLRRNPGILTILLGAQTDTILRESFMAAKTDDAAFLAAWKHVRELAKASMNKGAWIVNTASGARAHKANHYYTVGAKTLSENGVRILGDSDWIQYELD